MSSTNPVSEILTNKRYLIEIIIVGFCLALGINLLSSVLLNLTQMNNFTLMIVSVLIIVISFIFLFNFLIGLRNKKVKIQGFFLYNEETNSIIDIDNYEVVEHLSNYLRYSFTERPDLKEMWATQPLGKLLKVRSIEEIKRDKYYSIKIVSEILEYYIIERLTTHLTDYMDDLKNQDEIKTVSRKDIPTVLLSNRFLELFSRPVSERPKFRDGIDGSIQSMSFDENNQPIYFSRFDLNLPKETKIRRPIDKCLVFDTEKFELKITTNYDGYNTYVPFDFIRLYCRCREDQVIEYGFSYDIEIRFKLMGLLFGSGWEYYSWIDSFINQIIRGVSQEEFFKRIGWDYAFTISQILGINHQRDNKKRALDMFERKNQ